MLGGSREQKVIILEEVPMALDDITKSFQNWLLNHPVPLKASELLKEISYMGHLTDVLFFDDHRSPL